MFGVKRNKDLFDDLFGIDDNPLGWGLAVVAVVVIGLCVFLA